MYARPFSYHRAASLEEASRLLAELGEEAKILAGGQSLIPLMKLRFASPPHLVDINFIPNLDYISQGDGRVYVGPLARHIDMEEAGAAEQVPILHDCAAGIADPQVRNRGTLGGSIAEADPTGDWAPVLLTLGAEVRLAGPSGERTLPLGDFTQDAYVTALGHEELVREIHFPLPAAGSGGCYLAVKRCAPVYASASAAVQLRLEDGVCAEAAIALGAIGLKSELLGDAAAALRGSAVDNKSIAQAVEAARAASDPQPDQRGSAEFKRNLVGVLVERAIRVAARRARGERVEVSHYYA